MSSRTAVAHAKRLPINWAADDVRAAMTMPISDPRGEFDRCRERYNAAFAEHLRAVEHDGRFTRDPRVKHPAVTRAMLDEAARNFRIAAEWYCRATGETIPAEAFAGGGTSRA